MARTSPVRVITTIAAWATLPSFTLVSKTAASASSAARCSTGSKVVAMVTSSVVSLAR